MPFHRNQMALRPINRIKHVLDSQFGLPLGVPTNVLLANTTDTPTLAVPRDVETGSKINGFYLNVEAYATTAAALSNIYMILVKNPGGNIVLPAPNAVSIDDNKRFVIHQEMKMLQKQVAGNPRTIFNGVIAIPRGYRRNAPGDKWQLNFLAPGVNCDVCVQSHFKEFR